MHLRSDVTAGDHHDGLMVMCIIVNVMMSMEATWDLRKLIVCLCRIG